MRVVSVREFRLKMQDYLVPGTLLLTVRGKVAYTVEIHDGDTRIPVKSEPVPLTTSTPVVARPTQSDMNALNERLKVAGAKVVERDPEVLYRPRGFYTEAWGSVRRGAWIRKHYSGAFDPEAQNQSEVEAWLKGLPEEPSVG